MIQKIKCWLAKRLKKKHHWHAWEEQYAQRNEYEPSLINGADVCKCCGEVCFGTRGADDNS